MAGTAVPPAPRARRPPLALWTVAAVLLAVICRRVPLLDAVDIDFAIALALFASVCGGALAVSRTRARPDETTVRTWLAAGIAACGPTALAAGLLGLLALPCNDAAGWAFAGLLGPVSAFCGSAVGTVAGRWTAGLRAHAVVLLVVLLSIPLAAYRSWSQGIMFAFSPFFGVFPGPIYDEVAVVTRPLVLYRVYCLALAGLLVACWDLRARVVRRDGPARGLAATVALLVACGAAVAAGVAWGSDLGFRPSRAAILRVLSGTFESEHFRYHFPPGSRIAKEIPLLAEDHEFRYGQDTRFLDGGPLRKIDAYLYADAAQKKRLTGAGDTLYADVHGRAIHVNGAAFPVRALRHELVHALAGPAGLGELLHAKIALIEGLAVAGEGYRGDLSIHQWARAMRDLKKAPDLAAILGPAGFWREQGSRAYLLAGSFVLWLHDAYGAAKVRDAYPAGDFRRAFGEPLAALKAAWEKFLDGVEVSDRERKAAEDVFADRAIFDRACARCVARMEDRAWRALDAGDLDRAIALFRKASRVQPDNLSLREGLRRAYVDKRDWPAARGEARRILDHPGATAIQRTQARLVLADLNYAVDGAPDDARRGWEAVRDADASTDLTRQAAFRLRALDLGEDGRSLLRVVVGIERTPPDDFRRFVEARPRLGLGWYVLGRMANGRGDWPAAIDALAKALQIGLPDDLLTFEALRLLGIARYRTGDLPGAIEAFARMSTLARTTGERMAASEWIERCVWASRYRSENASFP